MNSVKTKHSFDIEKMIYTVLTFKFNQQIVVSSSCVTWLDTLGDSETSPVASERIELRTQQCANRESMDAKKN